MAATIAPLALNWWSKKAAMIISASRRTDIPAFYSDWFMCRLNEGQVLVPNPWNARQISRVRLSPDTTDCIVFWTKNPQPMLDKLAKIDQLGYRYYFSFTITPYGRDIEKSLPAKNKILASFQRLSDLIGPHRVDWRFDPIMISEKYPIQWHEDQFGKMCLQLRGYTERCIINFIKSYAHIATQVQTIDETTTRQAAAGLAAIAAECNLPLSHCTLPLDLREQGIEKSSCIDRKKIESLTGWPIAARKDPGQPCTCSCIESIDIGMYNTCPHGCIYCYATRSRKAVQNKINAHDPASPILTGRPTGSECITDRTPHSLKDKQLKLI